ncbi:hypothetical protein ACLOJK_004859, partial [Asimina triloba]
IVIEVVEDEQEDDVSSSDFSAIIYILMRSRWIQGQLFVTIFLNGSDRPFEAHRRWILVRFGEKAVVVCRNARRQDGLRSRRIGTPYLIADGLDNSDQSLGASPTVGSAAAM